MKDRRSFLDTVNRSVAYEVIFWLLLWGLYAMWAGYSPAHPGSAQAEPLLPLAILGLMAALFWLGGREDLRVLTFNAVAAMLLVPGFLALNVVRLIAGTFPQAWSDAGFFGSAYIFLLTQIGVLAVALAHVGYTRRRWKAQPAGTFRIRWRVWAMVLLVLLVLGGMVLYFVRT